MSQDRAPISEFLRSRRRLLVAVVCLTVAAWWWLRSGGVPVDPALLRDAGPNARLELSLAAQLLPLGLRPEPGCVTEAPGGSGIGPLRWKPLIFSAAPVDSEDAGGDLYRAEARISRGGVVTDLRRLANLTETSSSLERLILPLGRYSLWAVEVGAVVQGLLLVDAARDERVLEPGAPLSQRLLARLQSRLGTGQFSGVGLMTFTLLSPATRVEAEALPPTGPPEEVEVAVFRSAEQADQSVRIHLARREVTLGEDELIYRPRAWAGTPLVHWLVDTVRGLPWVGPRPIALLEKWVFSARSVALSLGYRLGLVAEEDPAEELGLVGPAQAAAVRLATAAPRQGDWPPPPVPPLVADPTPEEGKWFPFETDWLKRLPGAPPAFYKTAVRMPDRPPSLVVLVAMDLAQLDLDMVAGLSTPWSSTGNQGSGRIPREPERLSRVVAAFNGGFQTAHGAFGMMVDRVLVLEPWQETATLARMDDGTIRLGTWNNSIDVPADVVSFRQNMPPLLEDGVWNPTKRRHWGGTVSDLDQVNTTRSAVGYRGERTVIYAWSLQVSAEGIARALLQAGCEYGMHLDMNPAHAGFGLLDIDPSSKAKGGNLERFRAEPPTKRQSFALDRFVNRNGKDFFYLMLRRTLLQHLPPPPRGFAAWEGRTRPEDPLGFLPLAAQTRNGTTGDLLVALDARRLAARLVLGQGEPQPAGDAPAPADAVVTLAHPVALLRLGPLDPTLPRGLIVEGRVHAEPIPALAGLALDAQGQIDLQEPRPGKDAPAPAAWSLRQAPALLVEGKLSRRGRAQLLARPDGRHHALARGEGGVVYYLSSRGDGESMAATLGALGAQSALLLRDGEASRLRFLSAAGEELWEEDPAGGERQTFVVGAEAGSQVFFEARPDAPRLGRLRLPRVELDDAERRRQQGIQARINQKRARLREISNAKYHEYIEKVRERREAQADE